MTNIETTTVHNELYNAQVLLRYQISYSRNER